MSAFWTNALFDILLVVYVLDCLFMGLVIMMQRSKQEGLGAAFGGGFTESIWGAQTSQVLVKATVYATIIFFMLSIVLARLSSHSEALSQGGSGIQRDLERTAPALAPSGTNSVMTPVAPPNAATNSTAPVSPAPVPATNAPAKP
jgi:preprotein translocase subunit SecG